MMGRLIVVLGGTSLIAQRTLDALLSPADQLVLTGRNLSALMHVVEKFKQPVHPVELDMSDDKSCRMAASEIIAIGPPDVLLLATGALWRNNDVASDPIKIRETVVSNFTGPALVTEMLIPAMLRAPKPVIIALSSVAGDRGRCSNYFYGAAKAGLNAFLSGLRQKYSIEGLKVCTVKLGFVATPLIQDMSGTFLVASPKSVGRRLALLAEHPRDISYVPRFWFLIMLAIRLIPEFIFKRLLFL